MSDNILPFPVPKKRSSLNSPEIEEKIDSIVSMTECKGMILSIINDYDEVSTVVSGNVSKQHIINMSCSVIYRVYEDSVNNKLGQEYD